VLEPEVILERPSLEALREQAFRGFTGFADNRSKFANRKTMEVTESGKG